MNCDVIDLTKFLDRGGKEELNIFFSLLKINISQ